MRGKEIIIRRKEPLRHSAPVLNGKFQSQKYRQRDCFSLPIGVIWMMKMDKEKEFVTTYTQSRRCVLSRIVGRGLAPAEAGGMEYTSYRMCI